MNELIFYVDGFESVKKCEYREEIPGLNHIYTKILLPDIDLHNLFVKYRKNHHQVESSEKNDLHKFEFYDVDVNEIDNLIVLTDKYRREIERKNHEVFLKQEKIITRKKTVRKRIISLSVALFLSLNGMMMIKSNSNISKSILKNDKGLLSGKLFKYNEITIPFEEDIYDSLDKNDTTIDGEIFDNLQENNSVIESMEEDTFKEDMVSQDIDYTLYIYADDYTDSDKYFITKSYYYDTINKYANMYGLDANLVLAIATHESGIHKDAVNYGGAIGLFQIQVAGSWNWSGKTIQAYNFLTNEYDSVLIDEESVSDVFTNIKVGCMMIQNLLVKYDYDLAKAITAYNYGENYLYKVLEYAKKDNNMSDLPDDLSWLEYRFIISGGDQEYLENVFKYIPNNSIINLKKIDGVNLSIKYISSYLENTHQKN